MYNIFSLILLGSIFYASSVVAQGEINKTTDRFKRTKYMCSVTEKDYTKPLPTGLDFFRMSHGHYGVADLYGDGKLDFFFGFSDDTFDLDRIKKLNNQPLEPFFDNEKRSNNNHQYSFYSQDPDFLVPGNTKYLIARTFSVQDYNNDGIDDYAVAHWGRDYPPFDGRKNELLLSGTEGYRFSILPGGSGLNHSSAAGDIDNDGDIDLVFSRLGPDTLIFLENDGKGIFNIRKKTGLDSQPLGLQGETIRLWDVNSDGHLDLVTGFYSKEIVGSFGQIFWGLPGFKFNKTPTVLHEKSLVDEGAVIWRNGYKMETEPTALDFEFGDFDNDGKTEVVASIQTNFYRDWSLAISDIDGSSVETAIIDRADPENFFSLFWIHACDLRADGNLDLIYEHFGQNYNVARMRMNGKSDSVSAIDKLVWINDGSAQFERNLVENPIYFDKLYGEYFEKLSLWLGISMKPFTPAQKYFENTLSDDNVYIHPFFKSGSEKFRAPYLVEKEFSSDFRSLYFFGQSSGNGVQSKESVASSTTNISAKVRAIIEKRKRGETVIGEVPETATMSAPFPLNNGTSTVSKRVQEIIRQRKAEQSNQKNNLSLESKAQINDPNKISSKVKEIIKKRKESQGDK